MDPSWKQSYASALGAFLQHRDEGTREAAYDLGRGAVDLGLGLLELAQMQQDLLGPMLLSRPVAGRDGDALAAFEFFAETLAPFEMQLRGYREANAALKLLNSELELRVADRTQDLEAHAAKLAKSNEDLDRFATLASHDLQEPLRLISVHASSLEQEDAARLSEQALDSVRRIRSGVTRMRDRLNALLSYSRLRLAPLELGDLDPQEALQMALERLEPEMAQSGAKLSVGPLPHAFGSLTLMAAVFRALVGNAIKFSGTQPPQIKISGRPESGEVVFSVEDNGIGIEKAYWQKIFVIFQRLHEEGKYSGTGAGLAISKRLIENLRGRIWVEASVPGQGSCFCFSLPGRPA